MLPAAAACWLGALSMLADRQAPVAAPCTGTPVRGRVVLLPLTPATSLGTACAAGAGATAWGRVLVLKPSVRDAPESSADGGTGLQDKPAVPIAGTACPAAGAVAVAAAAAAVAADTAACIAGRAPAACGPLCSARPAATDARRSCSMTQCLANWLTASAPMLLAYCAGVIAMLSRQLNHRVQRPAQSTHTLYQQETAQFMLWSDKTPI